MNELEQALDCFLTVENEEEGTVETIASIAARGANALERIACALEAMNKRQAAELSKRGKRLFDHIMRNMGKIADEVASDEREAPAHIRAFQKGQDE